MKARVADSFIESIGVNTHLFYDSTVYYQRYQDVIKPLLQELGVRHIRDGGTRNLNGYLTRLKELKTLGISSTLIFDPRSTTPQGAVSLIKEIGGGAVVAVEGPNEYDTSGDPQWVTTVRNYTQQLYSAVKSDPATASLPVLAPSFTSAEAYQAAGDMSAFINGSTLHNYYSGRHPGTTGWGANGYGSITYNLNLAKYISATKPVYSTETGYHGVVSLSVSNRGVPEDVGAKYVPRVYLEHFNRGIARTFNYELINQKNDPNDTESNYGLLRNDGSKKPAFRALRNLISLLGGSRTSFTPGTLDYSLTGDTTNIRQILLQKPDKRFYLIVWQEVSSLDPTTLQKINVPRRQLTLNLTTPISKAINYEPMNSTTAISQISSPKQILLSVPDFPQVIELTP